MRWRFIILPDAEVELLVELAYSARKWGKRHAKLYRQSLFRQIRLIVENPYAYPVRDGLSPPARFVTCGGNYILYRVDEEKRLVIIVGFLGIRRDIPGYGRNTTVH